MTQSPTVKSVIARLAEELAVREAQVTAAVRLLDEGSTVPFIARYRKEVTGGLDDGQLRTLEERPKPNRAKRSGRQESGPAGGSMAQALRDAGFGR